MGRGRKTTLSDVASDAGVSTTTASYILNDRSAEMRIAPETETRVREAMSRLRYRPNLSARSLRTSTTRTVGLVSDEIAGGQYAGRMLAGANAAARQRNHLLMMGDSAGDPDAEALLVNEMSDRQVDGIVYARLTHSEVDLPPGLSQQRVVLLNCVDAQGLRPAVVPDEHGGGRLAAGTLIEAGFRSGIWVVGEISTEPVRPGVLRVRGIEERLAEEGAAPEGRIDCSWAVQPAFEAVNDWLGRGGRPRALICLNDRVAMGTCQALSAAGLAIPQDVSVVSFDGSELATWLRPTVTSVGLPFFELGALAVRMLLDPDPEPYSDEPTLIEIPMPLKSGESVRRFPGAPA